MPYSAKGLLVFFVFAVSCKKAEVLLCPVLPSPFAQKPYPLAAELMRCPLGHENLKDTPILYGLPIWEGEAGEELQRQIENDEITLGGCVITPESAEFETCCLECGFTYSPEIETWYNFSEDPDSLNPQINDLLCSFCVPEATDIYYSIRVGKLENSESVSMCSSASLEEIEKRAKEWFNDNGIDLEPLPTNLPDSSLLPPLISLYSVELRSVDGTWHFSVMDHDSEKVRVKLIHELAKNIVEN